MGNDYKTVLDRIKGTNPYSVLTFHEQPKSKDRRKFKRRNPELPEFLVTTRSHGFKQYFFVPELKERRYGAAESSKSRGTMTLWALALAELEKKVEIPTHILIYDTKGMVKHVISSRRFIIKPNYVGGYGVDVMTKNRILKDTAKAFDRRNYSRQKIMGCKIEGIVVEYP